MGNIFKDLAIKYHTGSLLSDRTPYRGCFNLVRYRYQPAAILFTASVKPINIGMASVDARVLHVSAIRLAAHPVQYALAILVRTAISALLQ